MKQEIILEYDANTGKVTQKLGEVAKEQAKVKDGAGAIGKEYTGLIGVADKFTGGLVSGMMNGLKATKSAVMGLQLFKSALISTGIGALVVAAGSLFAAFQRIQGVQDAFKAGSQALGIVLERVGDVVGRLGEWLVRLFTDPQAAIEQLWESIKSNIVNRFEGLIKQAQALGKVLRGVFELDWDMITEGAEEYGSALLQTMTGQEDFIGSLVQMGKEMAEAAKAAYVLAQAENALKDAAIALKTVTAEQNREIARQRTIAADTTLSIEERSAALEAALAIEEEQLRVSIEMAREELRIQRERMALSNDLREDKEKEAELAAKVIELETQSFNQQRRIVSQLSNLRREEEARVRKAREDALAAAQKLQEDIRVLEDYHFQQFASAQDKELKAVEVKYNEMLALAVKNGQDTAGIEETYQAQVAAINDRFRAEREAKEQADRQARIDAERQEAENLAQVRDALFLQQLTEDELKLEMEMRTEQERWQKLLDIAAEGTEEYRRLEEQSAAAIDAIRHRAMVMQQQRIRKELKDRRDATMQVVAMQAQSIGIIGDSLAQLAQQSDNNNRQLFEFGKALAIGSATVNTALAITDALAKDGVGPGTRFLAATAAGLQGAAQIATISRTQYGGGAPSVSTPSATAAATPTAPADITQQPLIDFGFLGQGAQENAVQAYVINQQLTNQQQAAQLLQDQAKL